MKLTAPIAGILLYFQSNLAPDRMPPEKHVPSQVSRLPTLSRRERRGPIRMVNRLPMVGKEIEMKIPKKILLVIAMTYVGLLAGGGPAAGAVKLLKGQTVYLPCYSTITSVNETIAMRANLFVHNADPQNAIIIIRVDLYDANGKLVEKYLSQPLKINPLAAARFAVKESLKGEAGAAANFMVQWRAENKVVEPLLESVFVGSSGTHGYSFSSQGRIVAEETD
jgi:hypothetical protein